MSCLKPVDNQLSGKKGQVMFSKIESIFVNQAKNVIFVCTVVAFLITGGLGVYIGILFSSSPDDINVSSSSQLSDYLSLLEKQHEAKYKKKEETGVGASATKIKKDNNQFYPDLITKIIRNINNYAAIVGEDPVNGNKFISHVKKDIEITLGLQRDYEKKAVLEELERETKKLESLGKKQHDLPVTDLRRVYTRDFYDWFFQDKIKDLKDAISKRDDEERRVERDKEEAVSLIQVIWIIAIVFLGLLAFLIYMRIDLGLRLICKFIAENSEYASIDKQQNKSEDPEIN